MKKDKAITIYHLASQLVFPGTKLVKKKVGVVRNPGGNSLFAEMGLLQKLLSENIKANLIKNYVFFVLCAQEWIRTFPSRCSFVSVYGINIFKYKKPCNCLQGFRNLLGAHERNRTFTPLRMADFESAASTNSATWAFWGFNCQITSSKFCGGYLAGQPYPLKLSAQTTSTGLQYYALRPFWPK